MPLSRQPVVCAQGRRPILGKRWGRDGLRGAPPRGGDGTKSRAGQVRGVPSSHAPDELVSCAQLGLDFVMVVVVVGQRRVNLRQCQLGQRLGDVVNALPLVHVSRCDLRNPEPRAANVRATATDVRQHVDVVRGNMEFPGCVHDG